MQSEGEQARPIVGVGAVVLRDHDILLVRRAHAPRQGEWSLPGGRQELGETILEAAHREVAEETGVSIHIFGVIDVIDLIERAEPTARVLRHFVLVNVAAQWLAGDARPASDASAVAWANEGQLDGYGLWTETLRVIGLARRMGRR